MQQDSVVFVAAAARAVEPALGPAAETTAVEATLAAVTAGRIVPLIAPVLLE